jgi:peroxiredoxin 5
MMMSLATVSRLSSPSIRLASRASAVRAFHSTPRLGVNVGDRLPDVDLVEGSPGNKVNLSRELRGRGLIIGTPAAFSQLLNKSLILSPLDEHAVDTDTFFFKGPSCSESHIPGYLNSSKLKDAGSVFVVSVNDPFV